MAGLFDWFGKKAKYLDEVTEEDRQPSQEGRAFFLDPEDAKSLGKVKSTGKAETDRKPLESKSGDRVSVESPKRRSADSNMDMFRKMARDLNK
jgi:hypothetical protein